MSEKKKDGMLGDLRKQLFSTLLEVVQRQRLKTNIEQDKMQEEEPVDLPFEVESQLNIPYMNRQEVPLAMDIFKPKTEEGKELPVIVTIHGGGLIMGDRKMHRNFAKYLSGNGYLVFTIEYRLAPRANIAEQLDDVCAGMDLVGRELVKYDVDFNRIFLVAESAGAFLATYVAAMKGSTALQNAIGYAPSRVGFKALGLICGMFYTQKRDPIGYMLSEQFYGDKGDDKDFLRLMDPENPEIIDNLPPAFLVTSRGDFLNNYTLMFHQALKDAGKDTHLVYYGESDLVHAFVTFAPTAEKSRDAISRMLKWFEEEAEKTREKRVEKKAAAKTVVKTTAKVVTKTAEKPAEKSDAAKPAAKKPVAKKPAAKKPAAKKPAAKKPAAKPVAKKPVAKKPATKTTAKKTTTARKTTQTKAANNQAKTENKEG